MPEFRNDTNAPITLDWCTDPDHFDANNAHTGTECRTTVHIIEPGEILSFGEARNKTQILDACQVEGLTTKETP